MDKIKEVTIDESLTTILINKVKRVNKLINNINQLNGSEKLKKEKELQGTLKSIFEGVDKMYEDSNKEYEKTLKNVNHIYDALDHAENINKKSEEEASEGVESKDQPEEDIDKELYRALLSNENKVKRICILLIEDMEKKEYKLISNDAIKLLTDKTAELEKHNEEVYQVGVKLLKFKSDNNEHYKYILEEDKENNKENNNNININNNNGNNNNAMVGDNDREKGKLRNNQPIPNYNVNTESMTSKRDEIPTTTIEWERFKTNLTGTIADHMMLETGRTLIDTTHLYQEIIETYIDAYRGKVDEEKSYGKLYKLMIETPEETYQKNQSTIKVKMSTSILNEIRLLKNWIQANDSHIFRKIRDMISKAKDRKTITQDNALQIVTNTDNKRVKIAMQTAGDNINKRLLGAFILFAEARKLLSMAKNNENMKDLTTIMNTERCVAKYHINSISVVNNIVNLFERLDSTQFRTEYTGRIARITDILENEKNANGTLGNILEEYKKSSNQKNEKWNEIKMMPKFTNEQKVEWSDAYDLNTTESRTLYQQFINEVVTNLSERKSEDGSKPGTPLPYGEYKEKQRERYNNKKTENNNKNGKNTGKIGAQVDNGKKDCQICKQMNNQNTDHKQYHCKFNPFNKKFDVNSYWDKVKDVKLWGKPFIKKYWDKQPAESEKQHIFNKEKYEMDFPPE